jgi:hydroxyethylthiazole kinase-like uncharacterized protein yjeF
MPNGLELQDCELTRSESETLRTTLPVPLYDANGARCVDGLAMDRMEVTSVELMERAGQCAFDATRSRWPDVRRFDVICGPGNNGGDGAVFARLARQRGLEARILTIDGAWPPRGNAATVLGKYIAAGGQILPLADATLDSQAIIVDALLGTGLSRSPMGSMASAVGRINDACVPVVSMDLPSGLNADNGAVATCCVVAQLTVTFIVLKLGLFTGVGPDVCGEIVVGELDVPHDIADAVPVVAHALDKTHLPGALPRRQRTANKSTHGHVLVVGGDLDYPGAVCMCAEAAARAGAGLITVATRAEHRQTIAVTIPVAMPVAVNDAADLAAVARRATVIAVGPGLGQHEWGRVLFEAALRVGLPLVVDADGLNWLARLGGFRDDWILTPHPGEAGRLLGCSTAEIEADRPGAALAIAARFGGTCLLKGAGTLVAHAGAVTLIRAGNPGMATGGSGDVLTGVVAALLAQGLPPVDAARLGALGHGVAGDCAAADGERGMIATDLIAQLRQVFNS